MASSPGSDTGPLFSYKPSTTTLFNICTYASSIYTLTSSSIGPNCTIHNLLRSRTHSEVGGLRSSLSTLLLPYIKKELPLKITSDDDPNQYPELSLLFSLISQSHPRSTKLGDSSLFHIAFSCRLLSLAITTSTNHLHLHQISEGMLEASSFTIRSLKDPACPLVIPVPIDNPRMLLAVLESSITPKSLSAGLECLEGYFPICIPSRNNKRNSDDDLAGRRSTSPIILSKMSPHHLAIKLLQSYLSSMSPSTGSSDVLFTSYLGQSTGNIKTFENTVFLDIPGQALAGCNHRINNTEDGGERKVAIFSCSLYQKSLGTDETKSDPSKRFNVEVSCEGEKSRLKLLFNALISAGVELVLCQRQVHPYLASLLDNRGVRVMQRLGIKNIRPCESICGVRSCSDWEEWEMALSRQSFETFVKSNTGHCELGSFTCTSPPKNFATIKTNQQKCSSSAPPTTVVLTALDQNTLDELTELCQGCIDLLSSLTVKDPYALAGAGCWEGHISMLVKREFLERRRRKDISGSNSYYFYKGAEIFSQALRDCSVIRKVGYYDYSVGNEESVWDEDFEFVREIEETVMDQTRPTFGGRHGNAFANTMKEKPVHLLRGIDVLSVSGKGKPVLTYRPAAAGSVEKDVVGNVGVIDGRESRLVAIAGGVEICRMVLSSCGVVIV